MQPIDGPRLPPGKRESEREGIRSQPLSCGSQSNSVTAPKSDMSFTRLPSQSGEAERSHVEVGDAEGV